MADLRIIGPGPPTESLRPTTRSEAVLKAQRAFFDAARSTGSINESAPPQAASTLRSTETVKSAASSSTPSLNAGPADKPSSTGQRWLRPGSIIDIKV